MKLGPNILTELLEKYLAYRLLVNYVIIAYIYRGWEQWKQNVNVSNYLLSTGPSRYARETSQSHRGGKKELNELEGRESSTHLFYF